MERLRDTNVLCHVWKIDQGDSPIPYIFVLCMQMFANWIQLAIDGKA